MIDTTGFSLSLRHIRRAAARTAGYAAGVEYSYEVRISLKPESGDKVAAPGSYLPRLALTLAVDPGCLLSDPGSARGELGLLWDYVETSMRAYARQVALVTGGSASAAIRVDLVTDTLGGDGWGDEVPEAIDQEARDLRELAASWATVAGVAVEGIDH